MQIVHTIAHLSLKTGGTARCVPPLCDHLASAGVGVDLVTQVQSAAAPVYPRCSNVGLRLVWAENRRQRLGNFELTLEQLANRPKGVSLIHDHGVWLANNHLSAEFCRRREIPRVVSVHGMLSSWAMKNNRAKKRLAWLAYQGNDLARASLLHATAKQEYFDIRAQGLINPVAVIPNGIQFPSGTARVSVRGKGRKTALFLGRIHPVKGLVELAQAWAKVRPPDWDVCIAGPDEGGHRRMVEAEIGRLGLSSQFTFVGPLDDDAKWRHFSDADLFVLPSHSENFGLVVAEALAAGLPVIATRGAPWSGLLENRCGWWCDVGVEGLSQALKQAVATEDQELARMGERGRAWAQSAFGWESVASAFCRAYTWLLQGGERPPEVMTD